MYLQTECTEKFQCQLSSKYDREHDFDVILRQVVPCRKLRWICLKHPNDVARQVETQQFLSRDKFFLSRGMTFLSRGGYVIP